MTPDTALEILRHLELAVFVYNVLSYACMMTDSRRIDVHDLPDSYLAGSGVTPVGQDWPAGSADEIARVQARRVTLYHLFSGAHDQKTGATGTE